RSAGAAPGLYILRGRSSSTGRPTAPWTHPRARAAWHLHCPIRRQGGAPMKPDALNNPNADPLKDMLDAEKQLTEALPRLAKKATHPDLKAAFEEHLEVTESHRQQVETLLEAATGSTRAKKCKGMEGLVAEGKEVLENDGDPDVIDAALIMAAQKAEHYEIAAYGSLRSLASLLGDEKAADRFGAILEEERTADETLSELATGMVNVDAAAAAGRS